MKQLGSTTQSRAYDSLYRIPTPEIAEGTQAPSHSLGSDFSVPEAAIKQMERDGVVCLRNVLDPKTVEALRAEATGAVANPSEHARFVSGPDDGGIFYYEFNLWRRHPVIRAVTFDSHVPDVAAQLMRSSTVRSTTRILL